MPDPDRYWAKTRTDADGTVHWLSVATHALDVAAVATRLLDRVPDLTERLAAAGGADPAAVRAYLIGGAALHDLGKFAATHQRRAPALDRDLHGERTRRHPDANHVAAGWAWWHEHGSHRPGDILPGAASTPSADILMRPVLGHHGTPADGRDLRVGECFEASDLSAVEAFLRTVLPVVLPADPGTLPRREKTATRLAWRTAGLFVLADWLGSSEAWFPVAGRPEALADRFADARARADRALAASGVLPASPSGHTTVRALAPWIREPTALQRTAERLPLSTGPGLYLVEDATGAGKTEAAQVLTARLMASGPRGVYWALPTMATADGMFERFTATYRGLFAADGDASLVLAHGRRGLNESFLASVGGAAGSSDPDARADGAAACATWLADGTKRALLAQAGVGTIDQALLAALPVSHQSLRLHGLAEKVLVVDEVHACDAYVLALLKALLTFQAAFGGSAVLLSATLPAATKRELIEAFECGRAQHADRRRDGVPEDVAALREDAAYPLITAATAEGITGYPVGDAPPGDDVRTTYLTGVRDAEDALAEAAARGTCAAWVRNTVPDALAAYHRLLERLGGERVTLLHARFTAADRNIKQAELLRRFGPESTGTERAGHVVVATQVIEQSLDVDFDVLVSDLAPMDLLVQRAGRQGRHQRDARGNRSNGAGAAPRARHLYVLGPDPASAAGAEWYRAMFPRAAGVYPDHGTLWRTARLIVREGRLPLAERPRGTIEAVYGDHAETLPDGLEDRALEAWGERYAQAQVARQKALGPKALYAGDDGAWWEEDGAPTRLGEPQVTLRLAVADADGLHPLAGDTGFRAWCRSEVRVPARVAPTRTGDTDLDPAIDALRQDWADRGRGCDVIVLNGDGTARNTAQPAHYDAATGLTTDGG